MADELHHRTITTRLVQESSQALGALTARHALSEDDIVNRALQLYAHLDAEQAAGRHTLSHDDKGETRVLEWL